MNKIITLIFFIVFVCLYVYPKVNNFNNFQFIPFFDKIEHFTGFLIITVSFLKNIKFNKKLMLLFFSFLGIILEFTHYFIPERTFSFSDMFANFSGIFAGIIIYYFLFLKNSRQKIQK